MPTINATPGDAAANSYCTLAEANTYMAGRLYADVWVAADDTLIKTPALLWATRILDRQHWYGNKTVQSQALRWPRYDVFDQDGWTFDARIIPQFLKNAEAELAFWLVKNDPISAVGTEGFSKIVVGPIELDIDLGTKIDTIPDEVLEQIQPYCNTLGVTLYRG